MQITIDEQADVRIIRLIGRLDGTTMQQVEDEFMKLVHSGCTKYVFDLDGLDYISSAGLRVMLLSVKKTRASGGKLALFGLNDNVSEIFKISGFSTIFSIFATGEEALEFVAES
jgi:anti-anti-sigma factor